MIGQIDLAGSFTLPGTSMTVNRMGYGAMQLAGRDGNKLVWGPPRDVDGAIAVLREAVASWREPHRYSRFLRSPCHEPDHTKGAVPVSRRSGDRHQGQRPARRGWIVDSGFLARRTDRGGSRQPPQSGTGCARCGQPAQHV